MPTIDEQLAALAGAWDADRVPVTAAEAMERPYVAVDAPPPPTTRRPRVLLAVAAVLVLVVGAGAWVLATSDRAVGPARPPDSPWWLPSAVPPGWVLRSKAEAEVRDFDVTFVSVDGLDRAVRVVVRPGDFTDEDPYTDPVEIDGRRGDVSSSPNGVLRMRLRAIGQWYDINTAGLTEPELTDVAASLPRSSSSPIEGLAARLPSGMRPLQQVMRDDVTTVLGFQVSDRLLATVRVSRSPSTELARLIALGGPLRSRKVGGREVFAGQGFETAAAGPLAVVAVAVGDRLISVIGGDDGTHAAEYAAVALSMTPVDHETFTSPPAGDEPSRDVPPVDCDITPAAPALGDPTRVVEVVAGAHTVRFEASSTGTAACVAFDQSGAVLLSSDRNTITGGTGPAGTLLIGVVDERVRTVRFELVDGGERVADATALPGFRGGVWAIELTAEENYRAVEFRDRAGQVVERIGRPRR